MLHLTQLREGGDHVTSFLILGLEGLILTSKALRMEKSMIEELAESLEMFPEVEAPERTKLKADLTVDSKNIIH